MLLTFIESICLTITLACQPSLIARHVLLSDDETKSILQHGIDCVESECSVDDVDYLINTLKEQQDVLNQRLVKVMNMVAHLQEVNQKNDRKTDEVRLFVKDLLRVFNHEVSRRLTLLVL